LTSPTSGPARPLALLLLVALVVAAPLPVAAEASAEAVEQLLASERPPVLDGGPIDSTELRRLYEPRAWAPLWGGDGERVAEVTAVLRDAPAEGLDPSGYHVGALTAPAEQTAQAQAARDVLLTDAVIRYAVDVSVGRLPPRRKTDELELELRQVDPVALALGIAEAPDVRAAFARLAPTHPEYRRLRDLLAHYRKLAARGAWPVVPDGEKLRPGVSDPAIPIVRRRLVASEELAGVAGASRVFDRTLVAAVRAFQSRNGLSPDGVIGQGTRDALNIGVQQRIDEIVVNMERWRWLPDDLGTRHVVVNIPAFDLALVDDGHVTLRMPVIVGRTERMTPVLSSRITDLVFNPFWRVPPTIASKDLLGKIRQDASYFTGQSIHVYRKRDSGPVELDPQEVNWRRLGEADLAQLRLRQEPGPTNPLGRVKFQMANTLDIYLHDSPARNLFQRPTRALSSGCVRVGDALGLATALLQDMPDWTEERRAALLSDWETHKVHLRNPVPVYLTYQTAWVDDGGAAHFRDDLYERDKRLAQSLQRRATRPGTSARQGAAAPTS
jgi:murein L,D-transpeptidase YcbB/YkuD